MNYEEMSDFEINAMVAKVLFGSSIIDFECNPFPDNCSGFSYETESGFGHFNGCNNPSDAWPIITGSKVGFVPVNGLWRASSVTAGYHECSNENPLRAAMIVFLMMKDAECQKS